MMKYLFFSLFLSVQLSVQAEQIFLCEKGPCRDVTEKITQAQQSIENGTPYFSGYGFFVDVFPGVKAIESLKGGVVFKYDHDHIKSITFSPVNWSYQKVPLFGNFDKLYKIDRDDMEIYFYRNLRYDDEQDHVAVYEGSEEDNVLFYEAYITHNDMRHDKTYVVMGLGFELDEFKKVLGSIRLGTPYPGQDK